MILVVGSLLLNRTYRCERLPSECGCARAAVSTEVGGCGGAVALAAVKAGADAVLAAAVGDDVDARLLRSLVSESGLRTMLSVCPDAPTGSSATFADDSDRYYRAEAHAANALFEAGPDVARALEGADLLVVTCDANALAAERLMKLASSRGIGTVLFAPESANVAALKILVPLADLVVVSDAGFSEIVRSHNALGTGDFADEQLHALTDAKIGQLCRAALKGDIAIMMGARGVFVSQRDGSHKLVGADGRHIGGNARLTATEKFVGRLSAEIERGQGLVSAVRKALSESDPAR